MHTVSRLANQLQPNKAIQTNRNVCTFAESIYKRKPPHYWNDKGNQLEYLNWLSKELNIKSMEDWYRVSFKELREYHGSGLLEQYKESPCLSIMNVYSDYEWLPWKFNQVPKGFWNDKQNQLKYMNWLAKQLNIKTMEDWYKISFRDISERDGKSLMRLYNNSPPQLVMKVFDNYEWLPWKFNFTPDGYWNDKNNQLKYMNWLAKQLNIQSMEDWYRISIKDIIQHNGRGLLAVYHNSASKVVVGVFPEYEWLPWKFNYVPTGYWNHKANQLRYMNWLSKQLNIQSMEDWYNVTTRDFIDYHGNSILRLFNSSPPQLLSTLFPDYPWDKYKFTKIPLGFLQKLSEDESVQKEFVEYLAKKLNIQKTEDWYQIRLDQLNEVITLRLMDAMNIVKKFYPDLNMDYFEKNSQSFKKSQYVLKTMLEGLFPDKEILEEYRHSDIENMELDYYIPDLKIAFEYQGKQHYQNVDFFRPLNKAKQMDEKKAEKCKKYGITLISVPYWWNKQSSSLKATIYSIRPDVLPSPPKENEYPIPVNPPPKIARREKQNEIQSELMLATTWNEEDDPTGWWMSEKYDGIRAYWNGKKMYSRTGREIILPDTFRFRLPPFPLDGELWTQRGLFQESVQLTRSTSKDIWGKAVFCVFDTPDSSDVYEDRISFIKKFSEDNQWPEFLKVIDIVKCEGRDHLKRFHQSIVNKLGEGVILRQAESKYEKGRSKMMRRYKEYQDTEVKVKKIMYPHGFQCEQTNGQELFVGINTLDLVNAKKVKEDEIITVKHSGVNVYNKLMNPIFFRSRNEMTWEQLKNKL